MGLVNMPQANQDDDLSPEFFNTRFNLLADEINGQLDDDNIKDNAFGTAHIQDGSVTNPKIATGIDRTKLDLPHQATLYYSTGGDAGGQVIGASEAVAAFDVAASENFGCTTNTGANAYIKVNRAGMYWLQMSMSVTDGSNTTTFLTWFDISLDNGATFYRLRHFDESLVLDVNWRTYQHLLYLPVDARVRATLYNGAGNIRVATVPGYNTADGRKLLGPKLTVAELR